MQRCARTYMWRLTLFFVHPTCAAEVLEAELPTLLSRRPPAQDPAARAAARCALLAFNDSDRGVLQRQWRIEREMATVHRLAPQVTGDEGWWAAQRRPGRPCLHIAPYPSPAAAPEASLNHSLVLLQLAYSRAPLPTHPGKQVPLVGVYCPGIIGPNTRSNFCGLRCIRDGGAADNAARSDQVADGLAALDLQPRQDEEEQQQRQQQQRFAAERSEVLSVSATLSLLAAA